MLVIIPLTKSPVPHKGRTGPDRWQDWYRGVKIAAKLANEDYGKPLVVVISGVHINGAEPEALVYYSSLVKLGVDKDQIMVIERCHETIGQLDEAIRLAEDDDLLFIVTWAHYLRVLWLLRGKKKVQVKICWGLPRWKEVVTDFVFTLLFPAIELYGHVLGRIFPKIPWIKGKKEFQEYAISIRKTGNQFP